MSLRENENVPPTFSPRCIHHVPPVSQWFTILFWAALCANEPFYFGHCVLYGRKQSAFCLGLSFFCMRDPFPALRPGEMKGEYVIDPCETPYVELTAATKTDPEACHGLVIFLQNGKRLLLIYGGMKIVSVTLFSKSTTKCIIKLWVSLSWFLNCCWSWRSRQ